MKKNTIKTRITATALSAVTILSVGAIAMTTAGNIGGAAA